MHLLRSLLAAFAYFSTLPVGRAALDGPPDPDTLAFLPLVGLLVGALAGTCAWAASFVAPHAVVVAVAIATSIVLTGALHVDGFMDTCDAVFAEVPVARRLEILRDPRHGTYAVAGFAIVVLFWAAGLWSIAPAVLPAALALAAGAARLGAVLNAYAVPYAREGELTPFFTRRPSPVVMTLVALAVFAPALTLGTRGWLVVPAALVGALALGGAIKGRLGGGLVGDSYGAIVVAVETGALAILAALLPA